MVRGRKKNSKSGSKIRVDFRTNRLKPAREKDWSRLARESGIDGMDTSNAERIATKGSLSRKRTVVVKDGDQPAGSAGEALMGTVVTVFGAVAHVDDGEKVWPCSIRRVLRTRSIRGRNALTVGDRVRFTVVTGRDGVVCEGVIEEVSPRRGELKRVVGHREHTVVANVDQAIIVTSAGIPKPKPHLVDRYIVAALHGRIEPVVCLNKIDQVDSADSDSFLSLYRSLGYKTLGTSAITRDGIDQLVALLRGKSSVLAGQSGVGKSSLLNAIQPGLNLAVGAVKEETSKGRHTTSRASLLKLDIGGYVVDTPGVKAFDISCIPRDAYEEHFVEFVERLRDCKFADCTHIHEVGCAVRRAVEQGEIHPDRYTSYVRLYTDRS